MAARAEADERERRLAALERIRPRGARPQRDNLVRTTLRGEPHLDPFVTMDELRALARRDYASPVVSLYLTLADARTVRAPKTLVTVFHSLRHEALEERSEYLEGLSRDARWRLDVDLTELEVVLREGRFKEARSIVVLKSGEELNRVIGLPLLIADRLVIDPDPFIAPLERVLETHRKLLVVEIEKETARLWTSHLGHRRDLDRLEDFVPTDTVDAGRPGKVQRHRLTHLQWHLRNAARLAERLFAAEGCGGLVLVGDERIRAMLEETLPRPLADRLTLSLPPADEGEIEEAIERELAREQAEREEEAAAELEARRAKGRAAVGLENVLDAANSFIVRRLLIADSAARPGYGCRRHHYLSLEAGTCPFCGEPLRQVADVTEELAEVAHLFGVDHVLMTERPDLLDPYGGAAAILYVADPDAGAPPGGERVATGSARA